MNFLKYLRRIDLIISCFVITFLISVFLYGLVDTYSKIPQFLFEIQDRMEDDSLLISKIGEPMKKEVNFSKDKLLEGDSAKFSVILTGKCDSSYGAIRGFYYNKKNDIKYIVIDTVIVEKCK